MTTRIATLDAILDSRDKPTLNVMLTLDDGGHVSASVPSGASTGELEVRELRDGESIGFSSRLSRTVWENAIGMASSR